MPESSADVRLAVRRLMMMGRQVLVIVSGSSKYHRTIASKGVGSALLNEIIDFCRDERVSLIYGEAKGELAALRRWYLEQGFEIDSIDNIQLSLT